MEVAPCAMSWAAVNVVILTKACAAPVRWRQLVASGAREYSAGPKTTTTAKSSTTSTTVLLACGDEVTDARSHLGRPARSPQRGHSTSDEVDLVLRVR